MAIFTFFDLGWKKPFEEFVLKAFEFENPTMKSMHWPMRSEAHQNVGSHYHICIGLNKNKRWGGVNRKLFKNGKHFNFTEGHSSYITTAPTLT